MTTLRIATRKSRLALAQTRFIASELKKLEPGLEVEELQVETRGDQIIDRPLSEVGGKGLFVSEVEACLIAGKADVAVHSMKDLPAELGEGLTIAAIPEREDPRDVFIAPDGKEIDALEAGSCIGTSSLRRQCQIKTHRPDFRFKTLRGNVDTRLRKLEDGEYDGIVLALAGLRRLGLDESKKHWVIPRHIALPAVGQGALGVEARSEDSATVSLLQRLDHLTTRIEVQAERALLATLEGSCKIPVAGHAQLETGGRLTLEGMVGDVHGDSVVQGATDAYLQKSPDQTWVEAAHDLGHELGQSLLDKGAGALIRAALAAEQRHKKQGNGGGRFGRWS